jgi:hypothetical protein
LDILPIGNRSVILRRSSEDGLCCFETDPQRDAFVGEFRQTGVANLQVKGHSHLDWDKKPVSNSLDLAGHSMVVCDGCLWLYGGQDKKGIVQGVIRKLPLNDRQLFVRAWNEDCDPVPRFSTATCATESKGRIYTFGGTPDGQSLLCYFWVFDIATLLWREIRTRNSPPLGKGYSLVQIAKDALLLTGGRATFGIYKLDIEKETWE